MSGSGSGSDGRYEEVDVEMLAGQDDAFQAWGWARLKVTKGDRVLVVKVKIASIPQDQIDKLRAETPKPPTKQMQVDGTGDDARRAGASGFRGRALMPDFNDSVYLEAMEKYNLKFTREIVGRGVLSKLQLPDGRTAETPEEKYQALEARGLAGAHFTDLMNAILRLTDFSEEERTRFF